MSNIADTLRELAARIESGANEAGRGVKLTPLSIDGDDEGEWTTISFSLRDDASYKGPYVTAPEAGRIAFSDYSSHHEGPSATVVFDAEELLLTLIPVFEEALRGR